MTDETTPTPERAEPIIIREGASLRTADELLVQFIDDALSIDPEILSPNGRETYDAAREALSVDGSWLDDADLSEALTDLTHQVESHLSDHVVTWNDGYTIEPYVEGADYDGD